MKANGIAAIVAPLNPLRRSLAPNLANTLSILHTQVKSHRLLKRRQAVTAAVVLVAALALNQKARQQSR